MKKFTLTLVITLTVFIINAQSPIDFGGGSDNVTSINGGNAQATPNNQTNAVYAASTSDSDIAANNGSTTYSYRIPRNQIAMQSAPTSYQAPAESTGMLRNGFYTTASGQSYGVITVSQGYFWGQRPAAREVFYGNNLSTIQANFPEVTKVMVLDGYYFITFAPGEAAPANRDGGVLLPGSKIYFSTKTNAWHLADCGNKIANFKKVGDVVVPNPITPTPDQSVVTSPNGDVNVYLTVNNSNNNTSSSEANNSGIKIINPPVITNPTPTIYTQNNPVAGDERTEKGKRLRFNGNVWKVVGLVAAGGTITYFIVEGIKRLVGNSSGPVVYNSGTTSGATGVNTSTGAWGVNPAPVANPANPVSGNNTGTGGW